MSNPTNRRAFLKQAAAATACVGAPLVVRSSVLGADGAVAPSNKITLGCIGVGGQGTGNMHNFLGLGDVRVVAVCDVYEDRRQRAKKRVDDEYGDQACAMFGDFREL